MFFHFQVMLNICGYAIDMRLKIPSWKWRYYKENEARLWVINAGPFEMMAVDQGWNSQHV